MLIDISEEDFNFIKNLSHEMKTQDHRMTADPYFFVLKKDKSTVGMDPKWSDKTVWVRTSADEHEEYESEEAAYAQLMTEGLTKEEMAEVFEKEFDETGKFNYTEVENVFLTYKGYLEHVRLNGHRYSYAINKKTYGPEDDAKKVGGIYSYVDHAFRNPEMTRLFEVIHNIGAQNAKV